jgi:hypothetical protein
MIYFPEILAVTCDLALIITIIDTDDQINVSRLIVYLARMILYI